MNSNIHVIVFERSFSSQHFSASVLQITYVLWGGLTFIPDSSPSCSNGKSTMLKHYKSSNIMLNYSLDSIELPIAYAALVWLLGESW